jgi:hypothetical protein
MPQVGFEPTIPVFERTNTVHALDRAASVIGILEKVQRNVLVLKVPRQCPLVLLVEVCLREGEVSGSEADKGLGCGLSCEQRS